MDMTLNISIKFASFNCKGLKSSINDVASLCENHYIIILQETWLLTHDMCLLQNVHSEFYGDGVSSVDTTDGILIGRPYGGLAVLWRNSLNAFIKVNKFEDETRLMGIDLKCGTYSYHILNIYMPFDCNDNIDEFTYYLYKIDTAFKNNHTVFNMAVGDFNSDILRSSVFGKELTKFCEENDYIIGDRRYLPENSLTFYSNAHDSVSWLDHAICSAAMFNKISRIDVLYNFLTSDHFVLCIKLDNVYAKQLCNLCDDSIEGFNITRTNGISWVMILCLNILPEQTYCWGNLI